MGMLCPVILPATCVVPLMQEMERFLSQLGAETDHIPQRPRLELADP
jgi:hypothetical protein